MRVPALLAAVLVLAPLALVACGDDPKPVPALEKPAGGSEVWLVSFGDAKIGTIKVVREITRLGLADAKALVERAPVMVVKADDRAEAELQAERLRDVGATVEIR
jgi:large subunit ribosomal protein L7/L12